MQDGRIAEQGNHEELLEQRGLYYRLIHAHEQAKQGMAAVVA
jgi:ABC-type multidrug transport system fused ATPase/permease subunit